MYFVYRLCLKRYRAWTSFHNALVPVKLLSNWWSPVCHHFRGEPTPRPCRPNLYCAACVYIYMYKTDNCENCMHVAVSQVSTWECQGTTDVCTNTRFQAIHWLRYRHVHTSQIHVIHVITESFIHNIHAVAKRKNQCTCKFVKYR